MIKAAITLSAVLTMLCSPSLGAQPSDKDFSAVLPQGLTATEVAALIAPGQDISSAIHIEARPWPFHSDTYIAIACFIPNKENYDYHNRFINSGDGKLIMASRPVCDGYHNPYVRAYLGVVKYKYDEIRPTLIAGNGEPLDVTTSWQSSNLAKAAAADPYADIPLRGKVEFFELVDAIPIADRDMAIGLRFGWNDWCINPWANVTATFGALALFRIEGNRLINIYSQPMDVSKRHYGDVQGSVRNTLLTLPTKTEGHFDLQVKSPLDDWWQRTFVWDKSGNKYVPAKSECNEPIEVRHATRKYHLEVCYESAFFNGRQTSGYRPSEDKDNKVRVRLIAPDGQVPISGRPLELAIEANVLYARLDAANYAVSDQFAVFGISSEAFGYEGAIMAPDQYRQVEPSDKRQLTLVMLDGKNQLQPIFSLRTYDNSELQCEKYDEACTPETSITSAVIVISPKRTNGFNDLIVRSKTVMRTLDRNNADEEASQKVSQSAKRYIWNGRSYEEKL